MACPHHEPAERVSPLLADFPPQERAELLTQQLIKIGDLRLLLAARNALTNAAEDLIREHYESDL